MNDRDEVMRDRRHDAALEKAICARLARAMGLDEHGVAVRVFGGLVCCSGTVADRRTKHRVEALARRVPGIAAVHNWLSVSSPSRD